MFRRMRMISTFGNQSKVPRLPIPPLSNLAAKYIESIKPLLPVDIVETESKVMAQFVDGFGKTLQTRLQDYDAQQPHSWLEDIWLSKAYLEWRGPSMINVNWWCQFKDHPSHPKDLLSKPPPNGVYSSFQIYRAAGLISSLLKFKGLLDAELIPPEDFKGTPMCMNQLKNMFGVTRVPGKTADTLRTQFPATGNHILVLVKNQIYSVQVATAKGPLSVSEIEKQLFSVTGDVLGPSNSPQPPIGILTAANRDNWYEAYTLLTSNPKNAENAKVIQEALFAVSLDDYSYPKQLDAAHLQLFHNKGQNRWFDKSLSLIVSSNGKAGMNGEHSPCDAVIPGRLMDYIVSQEPVNRDESVKPQVLPKPVKLEWDLSNQETLKELHGFIGKAEAEAIALSEDTESVLLQTDLYGSRYIKEVAQSSPDAYVQIALQLSYFRLHQKPTAVYESASTRFFLHGRTETGRSSSSESWAFAKSFDDDDVLYDTKRDLFAKAVKTQSNYMKQAAAGMGMDRHALGLMCMLQSPEEKKQAQIFDLDGYKFSQNFRLSSSNMSPGDNFWGGFGPVVETGYGINYAIGKDTLKFSVSSKKSCITTDSYAFRKTLERTLKDLLILFPKRSEVWGHDWKEKHELEAKESYLLNRMKELTMAKKKPQVTLAQKYKPKKP